MSIIKRSLSSIVVSSPWSDRANQDEQFAGTPMLDFGCAEKTRRPLRGFVSMAIRTLVRVQRCPSAGSCARIRGGSSHGTRETQIVKTRQRIVANRAPEDSDVSI